jgi:hypothetical protein
VEGTALEVETLVPGTLEEAPTLLGMTLLWPRLEEAATLLGVTLLALLPPHETNRPRNKDEKTTIRTEFFIEKILSSLGTPFLFASRIKEGASL